MPTTVKIKIEDNSELRTKIDELYEKTNQVDLAKWSLLMAKHVLTYFNYIILENNKKEFPNY